MANQDIIECIPFNKYEQISEQQSDRLTDASSVVIAQPPSNVSTTDSLNIDEKHNNTDSPKQEIDSL